MPFDVAGFATPTSLDDYLNRIGVTPIPMAQLQAHKKAQLRLNPPSLFATRKPFVFSAALGFVGFLAFCALVDVNGTAWGIFTTALLVGLSSLVLCFIATATVLTLTGARLLGRPAWVEQAAPTYLDPMIPEPIRDVVQRVRLSKPANATLYTGELIQNETVLDPYIVLHLNGKDACLGIWLDHKVIACAEMT